MRRFLPPPDKYAYHKNRRVPLWSRATVEAVAAQPQVADAVRELDALRAERQQVRKKQRSIRQHLLQYDVSSLIEAAREMPRRFVIHCGPTNSGKTYDALQALQAAQSGCYLGPLRLLALEVFDTLNRNGVRCSLLTGEEFIDVPFADITASTIEMCDYTLPYDVAVIDEAQLIADKERGGHWLGAILRVQAKEVHICVAPEGLPLIEGLVARTGSPYEVVTHERLTPLVYKGTFPANGYAFAQPGDAFIAFSRKVVLAIAAELEQHGIRASVIYGALPPQSRREEVRRFTEGENTVVVATDAIGMGVSLPIRRIIFCQSSKFDGKQTRPLNPTEIKQIAGRAGRYGKYDEGHVLAMDSAELFEQALDTPSPPITSATIPFPKEVLDGTFPLAKLLEAWRALPPVEGFHYEDMSEAMVLYRSLAEQLGPRIADYDEVDILRYITCPADVGNPNIVAYWTELACSLLDRELYPPAPEAVTDSLESCEESYRMLDVQHQMLTRAGIEVDVTQEKLTLEAYINEFLREDKSDMERSCLRCGKKLSPTSRSNLCDSCFQRMQGDRRSFYRWSQNQRRGRK